MERTTDQLRAPYRTALRKFVSDTAGDDAALGHAYELGRQAIDRELGLLELVRVHEAALADALDDATDASVARRRAAAFLTEALAPFDMVLRGYRESTAALQSAREEAERANRAKSEFLSRMSHELRTPLNAILGFGQLLQMDELDLQQRGGIDHIMNAGRHLLELINEVLDLARVESGRLQLSLGPVAHREVVGEALDMIAPLAAASDVRLSNAVSAQYGTHVQADRQRLKQVMLNLLANAVKYNRQGGEVRVLCQATAGQRLRLLVVDTGLGITEEDLARVFAPFERLAAAQTRIEGTGLGLALTKGLVEAMGGEIGAHSEVGRGSTFWVELDLIQAPQQRLPTTGRPMAAEEPRRAAVARSVLYVEDNLANITLVERILAHRPEITVLTATQADLGLQLAREQRPSMILLDLNLPDSSGDEVLHQLRSDPRTAAIPVVMVSAEASPGQIARLRSSGASEYLTKPLDVQRFLAVIDTIGSAAHVAPLDQPEAGGHGEAAKP